MRASLALTLLLVLMALPSLQTSLAEQQRVATYIKVFNDGSAIVSEIFRVPEAAIVNITLISMPFSDMVFVYDENGTYLYAELINNTKRLQVYTYGARSINVTYFTETLTSRESDILGTWRLSIGYDCPLTLRLPKDILILNVTATPTKISKEENWIVLQFPPANLTLEYLLLPNVTITPPQGKQGNATTPSPVQKPPKENATSGGTTGGVQPSRRRLPIPWIVLALVVVIVVVTAYLALRRHASGIILDEREREVVSLLRKLGGRAPQYELCERLNIPKSTMSRIIRRLEEKGIVRVVKSGRYNIIELQ